MTAVKKALRISLLLLIAGGVVGLAGLYILDAVFPFPVHRIDDRLTTSSAILRAAEGSVISWRTDRDENRRLGVRIADVSPWLVKATIAVEDKRFRRHPGVDPVAVMRAAGQNLGAWRRVSGASTITMQTIRLLWPRPRRLSSKIIEAFRAWQLERAVGKERILEIYFNLAPYGGNVIGAEAAARHYFGKSARQLTLAEASLLAGIPQSPARLNPRRHPDAARRRRGFVLQRMREDGHITDRQANRADREALELRRPEPRLEARHFAQFVLGRVRHAGGNAVTTLDANLQAVAWDLAGRHGRTLASRGVAGPALVVLSARDSSVLAYVGNASPEGFPSRHIDAVRVRRQPGSLLKPFIFALLADKGGIAPSTRVYDLPRSWAGYAPRNMDREWRGEMTAADALRQSRNVTAVSQLHALGADAFADFMHALGLEPARKERDGLAMALGSKEQTLLGLTNAYAALGRQGLWLPVRFLRDAPAASGRRVLSPGAAWLTLSALSHPEDRRAPGLVWKTGTSWNQQDAWAVAVTPEVVVGVWCGRLGRGGSDWVAGADDALPLALELAAAGGRGGAQRWPPPKEIDFREVCLESGAPSGWNCAETAVSPILSGRTAAWTCRGHRAPPEAAASGRAPAAGRLRITSPGSGTVYVLAAETASRIPLVAEGGAEDGLVWFVDGRRLGATERGEALSLALSPGTHRVSVSSGGETDSVEMTVALR